MTTVPPTTPPHDRAARVQPLITRVAAAGVLAATVAPATLVPYVAATLLTGALPVVVAWLTKLVLDALVGGAPLGTLIELAGGLTAAGILTAILPQVTRYLRAELEREVGLSAQDRLFAAADRFVGLAPFENPTFLDRLRLAQHSSVMMPIATVDGVLGIGRVAITVTGFLGSLLVLSPPMTMVALLAGVPTLIAGIALSRRQARVHWKVGPAERRAFFYTDLLSSVDSAKEIRLFGTGAFFRGRLLTERRTVNAAQRVMDRREAFVQIGLGLLAAVVFGGGLLWAVTAAYRGQLSVGDITIFIAAIAGLQAALATLAGEVARTHHALLMFDHYLSVTTGKPDLPVATAPRGLPPLQHEIELRDVWFRYSDEHPWVLRGVNLTIRRGEALGLVGRNGAGKSTLVKLLCRLYDPTRGAIYWDGVDIRDVDPADLRRRISAVFQDYMEYDMTAAENIGLGDLEMFDDRPRIHQAAQQAGIHDKLVSLPDGYDTLLSRMFFMEADKENPATGVVLSGGQWQRLALARAFLRDQRDLMILDEPSAGLDAEAEHEIHTSLRRHRMGRTSLLISHRLGAVRDADVITVLSDGQVVERGDHATLMASDGVYARLFALQASGYQAAPEHGSAGAARR